MTCQNCDCKKKKPAPQQVVVPQHRRLSISARQVNYVLAAIIFVAFAWFAKPYLCNCAELALRVEQLERHSVKVDAQFHKSLK
jgi:hypothetical protein